MCAYSSGVALCPLSYGLELAGKQQHLSGNGLSSVQERKEDQVYGIWLLEESGACVMRRKGGSGEV